MNILNIITNNTSFLLRNSNLLMMMSLFLIGIVLYQDVIFYDFVSYDDTIYMSAIQRAFLNDNVILWAFTDIVNYNWSPITVLSLALDYKLYDINAGGFHVTSLLLHCFNAILVFIIINIIFKDKNKSYIIALLFLIHPLNVETVAWISERKGVLSAFFTLLSLYFYLKINEVEHKKIFYSLALVSFCLALLSKAVFVTLPFIFILIDWYVCKVNSRNFYISKNLSKTILFFIASLIIGIITICVHSSTGAIISDEVNPLHYRLGNASNSYLIYLKQLFYPFDLTVMYRFKVIPMYTILLNVIIILGVFYIVYKNRIKRRYLVFGIIWYTLLLLPVLGIIQSGYHAHADRYAYIPLIGAYIAVVFLFSEMKERLNIRPILINSVGVLLILMLMFISWVQVSTWKNTLFLFEHNLTIDKDNYAANTNLAIFFILHGKVPEGFAYYKRAQRIMPNYIDMYDTVSRQLLKVKKPDLAVSVLLDLIKYDKYFIRAYIKIAQIKITQQQYSEAVDFLLQASKIEKVIKSDEIISEINYLLAYSYMYLEQNKLAIDILTNSVKTDDRAEKIDLLLKELHKKIMN